MSIADHGAALLRNAGWTRDRRVDTAPAVAALKRHGYASWPELLDLEAAYSGLSVAYERDGRSDTAWFGIERACSFLDPDWVRWYEEKLKARVVPCGGARHEHLALVACSDGRIRGGFDESLTDLGASVEEVLGTLGEGSFIG